MHPPTESRAWEALRLAGETNLLTVKGLEGGTDLPIGRACITARVRNGQAERLILHPRDHGCHDADREWSSESDWQSEAFDALKNRGPLCDALRWNAGAYLWIAGLSDSLDSGIEMATTVLEQGRALDQLDRLRSLQSPLCIL